ncbi:MAG: OmpA family protein [Kofleriaceae bacterium]
MNLLAVAMGRRTALVLALALGSVLLLAADSSPARGRVVVTASETTILDVVEFAPATATLRAGARPTLDAIAETLQGNPSLALIEVQAHTRGDGDAAANLVLSQRRADVIVAYLIQAGVAPARLVAHGYGDTQPLDPAAPANNERVSFLILDRAGDRAAP